MDKAKFAAKFKEIRERVYPDVKVFAEKAKMAPQVIKPWEGGKSWPRVDTLEQALRVCGWSLVEFFSAVEDGESEEDELTHDLKGFAVADPETARLLLALFRRSANQRPSKNRRR